MTWNTIQRRVWCALLGGAAVLASAAPSSAQVLRPPPGQPDNQQNFQVNKRAQPQIDNNITTNVTAPPGGYGYAMPPAYNNYAPGNWGYPVNYGRAGGYMMGVSSVMGASGQLQIQSQQARMIQQQVEQEKLQTRNATLNEWMYEQSLKPGLEETRENQRLMALRRMRNDPPVTEITAGTAMNVLMTSFRREQSKGIFGPPVPLSPEALAKVNVTSGESAGNFGPLSDGGKLKWPFEAKAPVFEKPRKELDALAKKAYEEAAAGDVQFDTVKKMTELINVWQAQLKKDINKLTPMQYINVSSYLDDLKGATRVLQDPNVQKYATRAWAAKGDTVPELVNYMTGNGLKFAPASAGNDTAYVSVFRSMSDYDVAMSQMKSASMSTTAQQPGGGGPPMPQAIQQTQPIRP